MMPIRIVMRKFIVFFGVCVLIWGCDKITPSFQCKDRIACVDIPTDDPIKIGVLQALSGKVAPLGHEQLRGMELALDDIQGQIWGHAIDLQIEDTGCTSEGGANSVLKMIADPQVVAIFGTTCSGAAKTASRAMSQAGLTMISGNNSAPFLTAMNKQKAPDWNEGYFRAARNEEHAGRAAAIFAFDNLKVTRAATINDGDIYSCGLTQGFIKEFEKRGGKIVLDTAIARGENQMGPVLTAVKNVDAQLLFFPLFQPEGNQIVRQARAMNSLDSLILMGDGALVESSFIADIQDLGKGMFFVGPPRPSGPASEDLARRYKAKYHEPPATSYYLYGFDAAKLLFKAITAAAETERDGSLHIGRQALRDALYQIRNVEGVTGKLNCNEFGDCSVPEFTVLKLDDPGAGFEGLQSNVMARYTFNSD